MMCLDSGLRYQQAATVISMMWLDLLYVKCRWSCLASRDQRDNGASGNRGSWLAFGQDLRARTTQSDASVVVTVWHGYERNRMVRLVKGLRLGARRTISSRGSKDPQELGCSQAQP